MTARTALDWTSHARRLADLLRERGDIRSPEWHAAIAEVPRHVFVPRAFSQGEDCAWTGWDTAGHLDRVYSPTTLVTALDDQGAVSSSTKPDLMVRMLETLDVHDGHRALEIGLGTGYNAALLSHRLGDERVFSVDVDPALVALARERLAEAGYRPTVAAVDGEGGFPEHAPYDRIIATCSVPAVPWSWAEQLAPGGSILVDYKLGVGAGNLVRLRRCGEVLEGRFVAWFAAFMAMRHPSRDEKGTDTIRTPSGPQAEGKRTRTTTAPVQPWRESVPWFLAHRGGLPRGVVFGVDVDPTTGEPETAFLTAPGGSRATVRLDDHAVTESGPTPLWEPVERAYRAWEDADHPGWDRLGLTVAPDGRHTVWLDEPSRTVQIQRP